MDLLPAKARNRTPVSGMSSICPSVTFRPTKRLALLINVYDEPSKFYSGRIDIKTGTVTRGPSTYSRFNSLARGNEGVFKMEAALRRGHLDLRKDIAYVLSLPGSRVKDFTRQDFDRLYREVERRFENLRYDGVTGEDYLEACCRLTRECRTDSNDPEALLRWGIASFMQGVYQVAVPIRFKVGAGGIFYDHIEKVFPDSYDPVKVAQEVLSFYKEIADSDTLTYIFARAHGSPEGFGDFKYAELIKTLDDIPGRKVLIILACHSGSILKYVAESKNEDMYSVIASTEEDMFGINWCEDKMLDDILRMIRESRPISQFPPHAVYTCETGEGQITQRWIPVDVII